MRIARRLAVIASCTLSACGDRGGPAAASSVVDTVGIKVAIQEQMRSLGNAAKAGDVEAVVALYTPDLFLREPGIAIRGADSLRVFLTAAWKTLELL